MELIVEALQVVDEPQLAVLLGDHAQRKAYKRTLRDIRNRGGSMEAADLLGHEGGVFHRKWSVRRVDGIGTRAKGKLETALDDPQHPTVPGDAAPRA
jgi:hypothetical protein